MAKVRGCILRRSCRVWYILTDISTEEPPSVGDADAPIIRDTRYSMTYTRIAKWLDNCLVQHESCKAQPDFIPSRVLDVGSSTNDQVRLVVPTAVEPYVALSYCWGANLAGVVVTTIENIHSHLKGINLPSLSPTVQDAVSVCRGLGIRFLWVDSLCIIQDDETDWRNEAASMRLVYSNSRLTIVAHTASSCKEGFLGLRCWAQPAWQRQFWSSNGLARRRFHLRVGEQDYHYQTAGVWGIWAFSEIEKRGWTLQECILSPRIVHFMGVEMFWECENCCLCECGHLSNYSSVLPTRTSFSNPRLYKYSKYNITGDRWMQLIVHYSTRELSHQSDKLVALSGLAQLASGRAGGTHTYLAGLWASGFPRQLLWRRRRDAHLCRIDTYVAPTWSWASLHGPVIWEVTENGHSHLKLHEDETSCKLLDETNLFGAVTSGELVVEGFLEPVCLATFDEYGKGRDASKSNTEGIIGKTCLRGRNGVLMEVICDLNRDIDMLTVDPRYNCWLWGCHYYNDGWCVKCRPSPEVWKEDQYFCLQVLSLPGLVNWKSIYFLVLKRSSTSEGVFERVGVASMLDATTDLGVRHRDGSYDRNKAWTSRKELDDKLILPLFPDAEWKKIRIV